MKRAGVLMGTLLMMGGAIASAAVVSPRHLTVTPASGARHTVFRVHAVPSPAAVEEQPLYYLATGSLVGHHPRGCVFTRTSRSATDSLTVALETGSVSKAWCAGTFRGDVYAVLRRQCGPIIAGVEHAAATMCPLDVQPRTRRGRLSGQPVGPVSGTTTTPVTTTTTSLTDTSPVTTTPVSPPLGTQRVLVGSFSFRVR